MEFQKPSDSEFTVYSKSGCNYCLKVKTLLRDNNQLFNIIDCDDYIIEDKTNFLLFIETISKREIKQFPIIFHKGAQTLGAMFDFRRWSPRRAAREEQRA